MHLRQESLLNNRVIARSNRLRESKLGSCADEPEPVVVEREALQVVKAQESSRGNRGQSHSCQDQAVEARQRQEVLLLKTQDRVFPNHQNLQGWQRLEPATVDSHQMVGVQVEPRRNIRE